jgi:hypothetical protein
VLLKVPAWHLAQEVAAAAEKVPAAHAVQVETAAKVPALQTVHADLLAKETAPTVQSLQELAFAAENFPAAQFAQFDAPRVRLPTVTMVPKVPATHDVHVVRPVVLA